MVAHNRLANERFPRSSKYHPEWLLADTMPDGWQVWLDWQRAACPDNRVEIEAVEADRGQYLGYVRIQGRRRDGVDPDEPITSVPAEYSRKPLLRS